MKRIIALPVLLAAVISAGAQNTTAGKRIVCDETCREEYQKTEVVTTTVSAPKVMSVVSKSVAKIEPLYAVVSPVGRSDVEMIQQAPRLETLDGKTIAVVGVSFMTGITPPGD